MPRRSRKTSCACRLEGSQHNKAHKQEGTHFSRYYYNTRTIQTIPLAEKERKIRKKRGLRDRAGPHPRHPPGPGVQTYTTETGVFSEGQVVKRWLYERG